MTGGIRVASGRTCFAIAGDASNGLGPGISQKKKSRSWALRSALPCLRKRTSSASSAQNSLQKNWPLEARHGRNSPFTIGSRLPQNAQRAAASVSIVDVLIRTAFDLPMPSSQFILWIENRLSESVGSNCCGSDTRLAEIHPQVAPTSGRERGRDRGRAAPTFRKKAARSPHCGAGGTRRRASGRRRRRANRRTPSGLAVGPSASTGIHNRRARQCANGGSADGVACTTPSELTARTILNCHLNLLIGKRPESRVFSE